MDDGASKEGRSVPLAQACRSPACELLAAKLGKSEQKRQRLRANLQKFREKLIDTNKLLELFNEVKQEKELAERQLAPLAAAARELETVRRQQTEDRRKLEEARDQLADKAREVKDLDAINARLRTKNDA
jgi:Zn-dependent M32 family carboxypeptidase